MQSSTLGLIVVALIIIAGGWYLFSQTDPGTNDVISDDVTDNTINNTDDADLDQEIPADEDATAETSDGTTVELTSSGFSPATITVSEGTTVTWTNEGGGRMWVASDVHPTHEEFSGTSRSEHCADEFTGEEPFDQCEPGDTYSFTFDQTGTWNYHNHLGTSQVGTVIVQ